MQAVPGARIQVAVQAQLGPGSYIYSTRKVVPGPQPTSFAIGPATLAVLDGPVSHPAPQREWSEGFQGELEKLEGTVLFQVPLRVAPQAPPGTHALELVVESQTCSKSSCLLPRKERLGLKLIVSASGTAGPVPSARPEPGEPGEPGEPDGRFEKHPLTVKAFLGSRGVRPGGELRVALRLVLKPGWHINSDLPQDPDQIPTQVKAGGAGGFSLTAIRFPPARTITLPGASGPQALFEGALWIGLRLAVSREAQPGVAQPGLELKFQACDAKTCLPPEVLALPLEVKIEGGRSGSEEAERFAELFEALGLGPAPQGPGPASSPGSSGSAEGVGSSGSGVRTGQAREAGPPAASAPEQKGLGWMLLFGFLGGLILNVMPCVLPVISLKAFALVGQAGEDRRRVLRHSLVYALGIWVCFMILAAVVIGLRGGASAAGWGFQFQNPLFVALLASFVFAFALAMLGVFEVPIFGLTRMEKASAGQGLPGSFLQGLFATLLATPCTAPLLAPAVGFAFAEPGGVILLVFTAVALGLAAPFLVLGFVPGWTRHLPRPGAWMVVFKEVMGFFLVGTVIWLASILLEQIDESSFAAFLVFLGLLGAGGWALGRWATPVSPRATKGMALLLVGCLWVGSGAWLLAFEPKRAAGALGGVGEEILGVRWHPYQEDFVRRECEAGRPVFLDATAAWCATCKTNERLVIHTPEIAALLKELGYTAVKADFTTRQQHVFELLQRHGRAGVPLYLVYPPHGFERPERLPELLTRESLAESLRWGAGRSAGR